MIGIAFEFRIGSDPPRRLVDVHYRHSSRPRAVVGSVFVFSRRWGRAAWHCSMAPVGGSTDAPAVTGKRKEFSGRIDPSVDLRTLDRHPGAAISSLIPSVSCRRCSPNSPFGKLEMLTAERP